MPVLNPRFSLQMSFVVSLGAALGSLFFSEVLHYPPCVLCWYQRVFMFPLVMIFGIALWTEDRGYSKYSFALASVGLLISIGVDPF
jgi:disulfide bond formation protein DsbB